LEKTTNYGDSEQVSRGENALNVKEEFQKSLELSSNDKADFSKPKSDFVPTYSADNNQLSEFIGNATETVEDKKLAEQAAPSKQNKYMSAEDATELALTGLVGIQKAAKEFSGKDLVFSENSVKVFALLLTPLCQKYGHLLENLDPDKVDKDSYIPECLAVLGAGVIALPMYKQLTAPAVVDAQGAQSGNKS
jgi:hypothetical protein